YDRVHHVTVLPLNMDTSIVGRDIPVVKFILGVTVCLQASLYIKQTELQEEYTSMKKQLAALLLTSALTFSITSAFTAEQAHAASTGTIVSTVNFRSAHNENSSSYGYLKTGEKVDIIEKVNNWWYKVSANGKTGYVSTNTKYIKAGSTTSSGSSSGSSTPANTS